jgi:hypothetical protein
MSSCASRSWAFVVALALGAAALSVYQTRRLANRPAGNAKGCQDTILGYNHAPWG